MRIVLNRGPSSTVGAPHPWTVLNRGVSSSAEVPQTRTILIQKISLDFCELLFLHEKRLTDFLNCPTRVRAGNRKLFLIIF